jgi:hypothetical protein
MTGFEEIRTIFSSPVDPDARLPQLGDASVFGNATEGYNRAATIVNNLLFGPQDYAVLGTRRVDAR